MRTDDQVPTTPHAVPGRPGLRQPGHPLYANPSSRCRFPLLLVAVAFCLTSLNAHSQGDNDLRKNVSELCKEVFSGVQIDADAVVRKSWHETNIERVIDSEVDRAIAEKKKNTTYGTRLLSGWSQKAARQMAEDVATQVFTSASVKKEMERLAERIAVNLTKELEPTSKQAVERGLLSIQTYLGANYSKHLVPVLERHIKEIHLKLGADFSLGDAGDSASKHAVALSGIAVIIASHLAKKVLKKLTDKICRRIIGRIGSRILGRVGTAAIPVVGWVIGAGMIAFDLIKGADGALPDIQEALKSQETKVELCSQVTGAFKEELPSILADTQTGLATEVFDVWLSFLGKYPAILMLTKESELFRSEIVEKTPADAANFDKLAHLVEVSLKAVGKVEVINLVEKGILQELKLLPEESHTIIVETGSPQVLYQWSQLTQDRLPDVVRLGVYRYLKPTDLDKAQVLLVLEVKDAKSVEKLLKLDLGDVKTALQIFAPERIDRLVKLLTLDAMKTMVKYGDNAPKDVTEEFVNRMCADPRLIRLVGSDGLNKVFLAGGTLEDLKSFLFWHTVKRVALVLVLPLAVVLALGWFGLSRWRKRSPAVSTEANGGATT